MTTLIIDNSIHRAFLKEGKWTARFIKGETDVLFGEQGLKDLDLSKYKRVILTGSEASITKMQPWMEQQMEAVREIVEKGIPLLGICFGHQLIARALGGKDCVRKMPKPEFGWRPIKLESGCGLFENIQSPAYQLCTHLDEVIKPPAEFEVVAHSDLCPVQAIQMKGKPVWGIQFHPEISIAQGKRLLMLIKALYPTENLGIQEAIGNAGGSEIARELFANFQDVS